MKRSLGLKRVAPIVLFAFFGAAMPASADYVGNLNPSGDSYLTLRQYSSSKSREISRMGAGTIVEVLDADGDWLYIETQDGRIGWAHSNYILPGLPDGAASPGGYADEAGDVPIEPDRQPAAGMGELVAPVSPAAPDEFDWLEGHMMQFHSPVRDATLAIYQNARFGTVISYPASLWTALPESENGDGRRFESLDGTAEITVYAGHNALERTVPELLGDTLGSGFESITATKMQGNRFEVSGVRDGRTIIHAEILDAANVQHVVEISMDPSVDATTQQSLADIAASLRVEAGAIGTQGVSAPEADKGAMELAFWNTISTSMDPAEFEAYLAQWPNGTFAALARNKINRLRSGGAPSPVPTPQPQADQTRANPTATLGATEPQTLMDSGWWVVVGSFPTEPWERQTSDYERTQATAARCGLAVFNDLSAKFSGFRSGYNVFVIGAFESKSVADSMLKQARKCFPDAYVKNAKYLGE
ncbi:MAG: SH3 domain-containing protein [Hoeflea sp.]|uniref:SH3 domain-containing protein n=2 Tax=Hoeflea sp. TaxID=1940281 RepID=UPI001DA34FAC|nr:SH3 domain-containing protein [Hoeflea sp.]MBU4529572.1 SH3 domain-containing protein [Alphaproteobacteria bacterium]MBU4546691.1 SH3 domain-containing protein [Alphaproteobacteria bacterium]MBU4550959.1 SH3 domain-containing protein [Alphaproteobacteria bacterium]MBV1723901.1 SH3 domain-containing protein [Hoeflea sp.]MBV1763178.1 SH3 domain-containing protein [Hoeflea sp.]